MKWWAYSREVAEELGQRPLESREKLVAELLGMGLGQTISDEGFFWTMASPLAMRRAYRIVKALNLRVMVQFERRERRISYGLEVHGDVGELRRILVPHVGAFLRGCFLTHGYMNSPERGPHLEFRVPTAQAPRLIEVIRKVRVKAGMVPHHGGMTVYVKGQEDILRLLAEMGAHRALLRMESLRVVRAVRNQVNRLVNSETANLARSVESGVEQARALTRLAATLRWQTLPERLLVVAKARLEHPDWSLKEIGQGLNPVLTKSAVNHRMRRLLEIAEQEGGSSSVSGSGQAGSPSGLKSDRLEK